MKSLSFSMFSSSTTLSVSPLEGFKVGVWDGLNNNATVVGVLPS